jgi:hypothetical protein
MAEPPIAASRLAPPPQPALAIGAPMPPTPPFAASPTFIPATGERHEWKDAYFTDERFTGIPKAAHPIKSYYNVFTRFDGVTSKGNQPVSPPASAGYRSYETGHLTTAWGMWENPLRFPDIATVLPQHFKDLKKTSTRSKSQFEGVGPYIIFVPLVLQRDFKERPKQAKARICLFFTRWYEINVFGLRRFFWATRDCALITVPGFSTGLGPSENDWGVGITNARVEQLLEKAGLKGIKYDIEVIANWGTGYRGMNETLINKLVDLKALQRIVYLDRFVPHDDFPLPDPKHPFYKQNTLWALDSALQASQADVFIYAYTDGVPRADDKGTPSAPVPALQQKFGARIHFIDLEFDPASGRRIDSNPLEKICLARMIECGLDDYYDENEVQRVSPHILPLVKLLPPRGSLGVMGRPNYTRLSDWVAAAPQRDAIARFPTTDAFLFADLYKLVHRYTKSDQETFRHAQFVPELGKECLLP